MYGIEIVYAGRDNDIELELRAKGKNIPDYTPISRVLVTFDASNKIDSAIDPQWLNWSGNSLIIKAGLAGILPGRYYAKIETWDGDHQNGLVWTEGLEVWVK